MRIARFLRAKVRFALFKVWIAVYVKNEESKLLWSLFLNERQEQMSSFTESDSLFCFRHTKGESMVTRKENKERIWSKSLLKRVNHSFMKSELLPSLFTYRQHFLPSLFFKEHLERKSKKTKSESTKERFPNPWFYLYCTVRAFRLTYFCKLPEIEKLFTASSLV